MTLYITIYTISLIILISVYIIVIKNEDNVELVDHILLLIGITPFLNTIFIILFFTLGIYWTYKNNKKEKIQKNNIYKMLHTR